MWLRCIDNSVSNLNVLSWRHFNTKTLVDSIKAFKSKWPLALSEHHSKKIILFEDLLKSSLFFLPSSTLQTVPVCSVSWAVWGSFSAEWWIQDLDENLFVSPLSNSKVRYFQFYLNHIKPAHLLWAHIVIISSTSNLLHFIGCPLKYCLRSMKDFSILNSWNDKDLWCCELH